MDYETSVYQTRKKETWGYWSKVYNVLEKGSWRKVSVRILPQVISSRVNELCRIVGEISYEPGHIEAVESRGRGEEPEVESVTHVL